MYYVSVPGSLMIFGEHAVLHGYKSVVTAIKQRIHLKLTPRTDKVISISSNLGNYETAIDSIVIKPLFQFILHACTLFPLSTGFDLQVTSEFSHTMGLGSSGAITVGTVALLHYWHDNKPLDSLELLKNVKKVIIAAQGIGSGSDAAASLFGGLIAYDPKFNAIDRIDTPLELQAVYSGSKASLKEILKVVEQHDARKTYKKIGLITEEAITHLKKKEMDCVGACMNKQQELMEDLCLSTNMIYELISTMRIQPYILGAKISGGGLGDCIIGLGRMPHFKITDKQKRSGVQRVPIEMSAEGLLYL